MLLTWGRVKGSTFHVFKTKLVLQLNLTLPLTEALQVQWEVRYKSDALLTECKRWLVGLWVSSHSRKPTFQHFNCSAD